MNRLAALPRSFRRFATKIESRHTRKTLYRGGSLMILGTTSASVFLELAEDVWAKQGFAWDAPISLVIHNLQHPALDVVMKTITLAGSEGATLVTGVAAVWLLRRQKRVEAKALLSSVIGAAAFNGLLKLLFARPRPALFRPLTVERTYSFPSGHTITAVALYGFLAILLWKNRRRGWALASGALIPLVGLSRVYLGVHYPSDVLAAMMLGTAWLVLIESSFKYRRLWGPRPHSQEQLL